MSRSGGAAFVCLLESHVMKRGQDARDCTRALRKHEFPMLANPGITSDGKFTNITSLYL